MVFEPDIKLNGPVIHYLIIFIKTNLKINNYGQHVNIIVNNEERNTESVEHILYDL